jgi:hypothetical protein
MSARSAWNVRYRLAASKSRRAVCHVVWDKTIVSRSQLHAVCIDAGRYVGIAMAGKLASGRFEIVRFEVNDAPDEAAAVDDVGARSQAVFAL